MGHFRRRLSIGSSKSRAQSANAQTGVMDVEDTMLSQEIQCHDITDQNGGETPLQEVAGPSDGAIITRPSPQQKRRPSFLTKLRRRSSSVAPPTLDSPGGSATAVVSDDVVAAAAAAEMARGTGDEDTSSQRGRLSRRSSFSVMAQARAVLGRRSLSKASEGRENHLNTNTAGDTVAPNAPDSKSLLEEAFKGVPPHEGLRPNSPCIPPSITLTRDPTEDAHDEEGAYFSHLPLEKDPLDIQQAREEESSMLSVAASPELDQENEDLQGKEVAAVEQDSSPKDEMALSETSDQLTIGAPASLVSAEDASGSQEVMLEHGQEEGASAKADEPSSAMGPEKPRRRMKVSGQKKDGRSGGGSAKSDSRKEKAGKALKKDVEKRENSEEQREAETIDGPDEITKPVSRWRRRLSLSRERRLSTQSRLQEEKKEGDNESILDCESVCTPGAGKQGYLGRIRRKISISRERRASRDGSIVGKKDDTGEEGRTYTSPGIERATAGNGEEEVERTTDILGTEGCISPKRSSGCSRLRRSSITSAVNMVRGRSRDARGGAGAQHEKKETAEQEIEPDNGSITGEKHSLAKSLRRRLSRSSLRLPRAHSRESSLCSKGQEVDECGTAYEGSECAGVEKEKRTWRRRISDHFRSKSRDPPLPSSTGMPSIGRGAGIDDQKVFSEDMKSNEYANTTLESDNAAGQGHTLAVEKGSALQEPVLGSEEERNYNEGGHRSGGEKANTKGALSEELSEPFAVTPETSQTPSEQPSSADMTPRYRANEYSQGQKVSNRGKSSYTLQRDRSSEALAEDRLRRGIPEIEMKNRGASPNRSGAEDFMQWMKHNQEEEEEEEGAYVAYQDEEEMKYGGHHKSEGDRSIKEANSEQGKKLGIFFCCGNDDNDTAGEKDTWKQTLRTRLAEGQGLEDQYGYGKGAQRNRHMHLPQPLRCKDLFEDTEVGSAYPLCYAPTDCLLELGMAI